MEIKQTSEKRIKLKLYIHIIGDILILSLGIYYLIKNNNLIIYSFIILIIGFFIGLLKSRISKIEIQKDAKTYIRKIDIVGIIILFLCIVISIFRKKLLAKYFVGQQITVLIIWFIFGMVVGKIIMLKKLLIKLNNKNN